MTTEHSLLARADAPTEPVLPVLPVPPALRTTLDVEAFGLSDTGRVRKNNEDHFLVAELTKALRVRQSSLPQPRTQYSDERGYLFVVADGMGGHQAGEQASTLALQTVEEFVLNTLKSFFHMRSNEGSTILAEFQEALRHADQRIFEAASARPELRGMGTTLTVAYYLSSQLFLVHVGDSRCYLQRGEQLYQLTRDHTVVDEMLRRGILTAEQAASHRLRHVITNAVGGTEPGLHVEAHRMDMTPGDVLLLCSDGLTEMLSNEHISEVLRRIPATQASCERLVADANQAGGVDNITAVVVRFV